MPSVDDLAGTRSGEEVAAVISNDVEFTPSMIYGQRRPRNKCCMLQIFEWMYNEHGLLAALGVSDGGMKLC